MTRFRQWWRRMVRGGHAYAEVSQMHRDTPQRIWAKESRSIWVWGLGVPAAFVLAGIVAFALGLPVWPVPVAFVALHAVQFARIFRRQRGRGMAPRHAGAYTLAVLVGKYAQVVGQAKFWRTSFAARPTRSSSTRPPPRSPRRSPPECPRRAA